jgi:anaerobic selenocysteine-containing dehydrogenase
MGAIGRRRGSGSFRPRPFTSEIRNTCTYCSVACGVLIYSMGDRAKNAKSSIIHI